MLTAKISWKKRSKMKIFFMKYGLVFKWDASQVILVTDNPTFMFLDN